MKAADYLRARGWFNVGNNGHRLSSVDDERWAHVDSQGLRSLENALTIQRARDATELRRCVADAIANAASRHSKLDHDAALSNIMHAAGMAETAWLRLFGVEVES